MTSTGYLRMLTRVRELADRHMDGPADAALLHRFVATKDAAAFEVLVWRHGAMVHRVCRGVLRQDADSDDAFQATFLALARDASSIRKGQSVGAWLHRVAFRLANRLRTRRRILGELPGEIAAVDGDPSALTAGSEQTAIILDEIDRLPACYRETIVLCLLEGKSHSQAALELNCPNGTVDSRLAWARQRLRERLLRRGVAPVAMGLLFASDRAIAAPAKLVRATLQLTRLFVEGGASAVRSAVSTQAWTLLNETGSIMTRTPTRIAIGLVLLLGAAGFITHGRHAWKASAEDQPTVRGKAVEALTDSPWRLVASWQAGKAPITCLLASPGGNVVAVNGGSKDQPEMGFWTIPGGKLLSSSRTDAAIRHAAISLDGKLVAVANDGGDALILDAATGKIVRSWKQNRGQARALAFAPDGRLAVGLESGAVLLWDTSKPLTARLDLPLKDSVSALLFTPDGKRLLTAADGTVRVWDVGSGKQTHATAEWDRGRRGLATSADGKLFAIARINSISINDLATGKEVRRIHFEKREVADVAFTPDGKSIAIVTNPILADDPSGLGDVRVFDLSTGKSIATLGAPHSFLLRLAVTPNGKYLLAGGHDGFVHVWERSSVAVVGEKSKPAKDRLDVLAAELAKSGRSNDQCIDALFLATLGRFPQETERKPVVSFIEKASDRESAFKDVVFQLIHTKEHSEHVKSLQERQKQ